MVVEVLLLSVSGNILHNRPHCFTQRYKSLQFFNEVQGSTMHHLIDVADGVDID